jgi:hypothetical protein
MQVNRVVSGYRTIVLAPYCVSLIVDVPIKVEAELPLLVVNGCTVERIVGRAIRAVEEGTYGFGRLTRRCAAYVKETERHAFYDVACDSLKRLSAAAARREKTYLRAVQKIDIGKTVDVPVCCIREVSVEVSAIVVKVSIVSIERVPDS